MKPSSKKTNRIVFTFITFGMAFLVAFTSIILINNKTFVDKVFYRSVLDDAKGLSAKPAIYFKGIEIGRISDFRLNQLNNDIEVDFYIFADYQNKVVRHAVLSGNQSVLLDTATEFKLIMPNNLADTAPQVLEPGSVVPYISSKLGQQYLRQGMISIPANSVDSIITSINNLLINLQRTDNAEAGAIFKILDRMATISDHLVVITQQLSESQLVSESELLLSEARQVVSNLPQTQQKFDQLLSESQALITQMESAINAYQDPAKIVSDVSDGQVPEILNNANESLAILKGMINDVHAERLQLMVTINTVLKVLNKMDKTLQGVNNNPLLRGGIEEAPKPKGIEMND